MSNVRWFWNNLAVASGTDLTGSTEDPFFPATNIKSDFTTKVFRTPSGTNTGSVIFDLKTIEAVDSILVNGPSNSDAGFVGSLTVEANGTSDFTSPAFTTTLTFNPEFNLGIKVLTSDESYRFWRISGTGGDFFELGKVYIGKSLQLTTNNIDLGWSHRNGTNNKVVQNRYGQKFVDKINEKLSIKASYKFLNVTELESLLDMFDFHGTDIPLWMVVDESETIISDQERFAGMFYFRRDPDVVNESFQLYNLGIDLEEAL